MEVGPQDHSKGGILGPNSIVVVYMDPLGDPYLILKRKGTRSPPRHRDAVVKS